MDSPGEILRLCRLCLVKDQVNIPIFEEEGDSREIFLKISSCLPVKVSREDRLPKKICDGCSEKLNSFYEFWSSSANAEKTLLSWVGEEEVEEKEEPAISKSLAASATLVKEESELVDEAHAESIEESTKDEADEAPPAKRARRSAAVKAQINLAPDSEDDDLDMGEPLTKTEEESAESDGEDKDPSYTDMPGTSADDEQAGPSGMGKDGVEAPRPLIKYRILKKSNGEPEDTMEEESNFKFRDHHNKLVVIPKNDWGYHCCYCVRKFTKRFDLKQHIVSHLLRSNKLAFLYICEPCDKTFRGEKALFRHRRLMHSTLNSFLCQACGQAFKSELKCRRHHCSNVFPVIKPQEPIVMPVITSFGTVTDDIESKKRTDPTTGYESEYAKFLAVVDKDAKRYQLKRAKEEKQVKRKRTAKKVVVIENDDSPSGTVLETEPDLVSVLTPSASSCNKVKPKICVKEFAHFSE